MSDYILKVKLFCIKCEIYSFKKDVYIAGLYFCVS